MHLHPANCPADLRSWTALTGPQMYRLVEQMCEQKPDTGRGRPWALPFTDPVPLLVLASRTSLTMQQLGSLFGISDSTVHRVVDRLADCSSN
ncbi:transposase family protein [Streptomyces sp. NPDC101149]|uniref:transposase family protein n=1 Tax=Streptomyces sp. NPDC101149 TaxID=3366113 RepID=UPI003825D9C0